MDYNKLAELLFPDVVNGPDYYEKKFPERDLPKLSLIHISEPTRPY